MGRLPAGKILAFVCLGVTWLVVAEFLVRLLIPLASRDKQEFVSLFIPSTDNLLGYQMRPSFTKSLIYLTQEKITYQTNSRGLRDREFPLRKDNKKIRIAAMGDSITFGIGVQADGTYPKILEKILSYTGENVEVINFGIGGYNSQQEFAQLTQTVLAYDPDIVVLGYALNDADPKSDWAFDSVSGRLALKDPPVVQSSYRGPFGGRLALVGRYLDQSRLYWLTKLFFDRVKNPSPPPKGDSQEMSQLEKAYVGTNSSWTNRRDNLVKIRDAIETSGGKFLLVVLPTAYQIEHQQEGWSIQNTVNEFTSNFAIATLDLLPPLEAVNFFSHELFLDAGHFTKLGNTLVAENIAVALYKYRLLPK